MSEPTKQQIGDGQDNFGQAAGQMAKAANYHPESKIFVHTCLLYTSDAADD